MTAKPARVDAAPADAGADSAPAIRYLTKADILAADDLPREPLEVPEWGGSLWVQGLTGTDRDGFETDIVTYRTKSSEYNLRNFRAKLVARSVTDEHGKRLFTDGEIELLGKKSAIALQRVYVVAERLSGLSKDEVEELTEALKDDPSVGSGSDSA